jgi:hypothetical protein
LPDWLAAIEQVPVATRATVTPETVQTEGELEANVTVNPELAVAVNAKDPEPSVRLLNEGNVIVCGVGIVGLEGPISVTVLL